MLAKTGRWIKRHPFITVAALLLSLFFISTDPEPPREDNYLGAKIIGVGFIVAFALILAYVVDRVFRRARWKDDLDKLDYSDETYSEGNQQTPMTVQITSNYDERAANQARIARDLEEAKERWKRDGHRKNRPNHDTYLDQQPITTDTPLPPVIEQIRGRNITLKELIKYTPAEFEEFCARALNAMGYKEMKRNGGAGDLQADVIGKDSHDRSTIVQCKRYKPGSKVGTPVIQTFIGMKSVHHRADRGIFMTTADYSAPAKRLAQQHDIVLIDGDDLVKIAGLVFAPRVEARPKYQVKFCSSCGSEIESHEIRFCGECGSPIQR